MSVLMKRIEDRIFRSSAPKAIRHLTLPDLDASDPVVRAVLDQAATEFQVAPPLTIHLSDPTLLAGLWHAMREAYVVNPASRARREAVAAAASQINACPYCITVHEGMFAAAGGDQSSSGSNTGLGTEQARDWASSTLSPGSEKLKNPGIAPKDIPQIYGTATMFHYVNRMVSVFLTDSPVPIPGMATSVGRKLAHSVFSIMSKRMAQVDAVPGQSAVRVPAPLPVEFAWAKPDHLVAEGLAHFALAAETAGQDAVPAQVRQIVLDNLNAWQGETPPLSRAWLEDAIADLDAIQKPAARLALLTARAPWQVDETIIAEFSEITPGDKALVQTCGWAAFAATRRITRWFEGYSGGQGA